MNSQVTVYRTPTDPNGVTGEQLAKMTKREQRQYVVAWFYENYNNADDVSIHNTVEDHPSDYRGDGRPRRLAANELYDEFRIFVPEKYIDEIVDVLRYDNRPSWAQRSGEDIPDYPEYVYERLADIQPKAEDMFQPRLGDAWGRAMRDNLIVEAEELEDFLAQPPGPLHGMRGHNQGPETADDEPDNDLDERVEEVRREIEEPHDEVKGAIEVIKNELEFDHPYGESIAKAAQVLKKFGIFAAGVIGTKVVEATADTAYAKLAEAYPGLLDRVLVFLERVVDWLEYVTFP